MTADKPSPFVPKLRFSEFRDAPDWEEVSLGTLLVRAPDYGVNAAAVPFSETLPTYIRITDINSDGQFAPCPRVSVDSGADEEQYLRDGDIVLARTGASVGKSYRYREEDGRLVYAGFLIRVRPNPQRLLSQFLAAYLSAWSYWDWVRLTSARSGQPGINGTEYASMPLPLPPNGRALAEQKKIADCLGSLDDLIAAEGRKLEALRQHKQGLMQQLFPQPGETQPRLRLPEFQDTQEWHVAPLGKLFETTTGGTPDRARPDYWGGEVPWVTTSIVDFNVIESTRESISSAGLSNSSAKVFPKRTVLVALYGQGKTRGKVAMLGVEAATNQACAAILPSDEVDPRFVFLNLSGRYEEIRANSNSGGQKNLSQALVRDLPFAYPKERAEQHRIAECLTALDDQIAAQARKLETLKQHKRGLLQQLFPKPETA